MGKLSHDTFIRLSTPFNTHYVVNGTDVNNVAKDLTGSIDFGTLFNNPSDFVISLKLYPFNVAHFLNQREEDLPHEYIKYGKSTSTRSQGYNISNIYIKDRVIAEFSINAKYNNFLDYAPYTKLELYLPFIGVVTLDNNLVMGKYIIVSYSVDFDTGGLTAHIQAVNGEKTLNVMTCSGLLGFDIPIGATNTRDNERSLLANGLSLAGGLIASIATENPLPAIMAGLNSVSSVAQMQERVTKGGAVSNKGALTDPYSVYLIRTYYVPANSLTAHRSYKGLPLHEVRTLSELTGYTKVERIHIEDLGTATESERAEVERLLQLGVIL